MPQAMSPFHGGIAENKNKSPMDFDKGNRNGLQTSLFPSESEEKNHP